MIHVFLRARKLKHIVDGADDVLACDRVAIARVSRPAVNDVDGPGESSTVHEVEEDTHARDVGLDGGDGKVVVIEMAWPLAGYTRVDAHVPVRGLRVDKLRKIVRRRLEIFVKTGVITRSKRRHWRIKIK